MDQRRRARQLTRECRRAAAGLFALLVLPLIPAPASAQDVTAVLSGRVLDVTDDAPIAFATVVVEHLESGTTVSGTLAGEDGRFIVQGLPPGAYGIHLSFVGFYPVQTDVLVSELNQSYDLGDIRLARLEGFEEEITVTAETLRARAAGSTRCGAFRASRSTRTAESCCGAATAWPS